MATTSSNMTSAKKAKNDEFFTTFDDIEKEMKYYRDQFKGKIVYCNCDDARESNFSRYFLRNFENLGLKKLISTGYKENGRGVKSIFENGKEGFMGLLEGNGDFRSEECIEFLREADIVVTNPPFSLFREYVAQLMEFNKKFCIIGNMNAITYKDFFPYIMNGQIWLGKKNLNTDMAFMVPSYYEERSTRFWIDENGQHWRSLGNACWFTNMEIDKIGNASTLISTYNENEYPKYDDYNAINVNKVAKIPYDYNGLMGVPITIVDKVCSDGLIHFGTPMLDETDSKYEIKGIDQYMEDNPNYGHRFKLNGKELYARILIQKVID